MKNLPSFIKVFNTTSFVLFLFLYNSSYTQIQTDTTKTTILKSDNDSLFTLGKPSVLFPKKKPNAPVPKAIKQALDSIVYLTDTDNNGQFDRERTAYTYDDLGRVIVSVTNSYKEEFTYDANGNATLYNGYSWDGSQWVINSKAEYTYDANGNETLFNSYSWDGSQWVNDSKGERTYDGNGNTILEQGYVWDGSQWVNDSKDEYSFDGNGNETLAIFSYWMSGQWVNASKREQIFDGNGNQTLAIDYNWDGSQYVNNLKQEYSYDGSGNQTVYTTYQGNVLQWVNQSKQEYTYDANGNKILMMYYWWNSSGQWENTSKTEYTYDANGNKTLEIGYTLVGGTVWEPATKIEITHNLAFTLNDLVLPVNSYYSNNQFVNEKTFNINNGNNVLQRENNYHYSAQNFNVASLTNTAKEPLKFYPNPAKDVVNISGLNVEKVSVFSMNGHEMLSLKGQNKIDVSTLSPGLYLIQVESEIGKSTERFVKE